MHGKTYEDQKASVVQAAALVIKQFGFGKTTMNDIAQALHLGKSSLYHYFQSKEDIFVEVFKTKVAELRGEFLKAIDAEPTPEGKIRAYILKRTEMLRRKLTEHMEVVEDTPERYDLLLRIHEIFDEEEDPDHLRHPRAGQPRREVRHSGYPYRVPGHGHCVPRIRISLYDGAAALGARSQPGLSARRAFPRASQEGDR